MHRLTYLACFRRFRPSWGRLAGGRPWMVNSRLLEHFVALRGTQIVAEGHCCCHCLCHSAACVELDQGHALHTKALEYITFLFTWHSNAER